MSLHVLGQLRGCIGTLVADEPLHASVARLARVAAFEDPRFTPLQEIELTQIEIEISILSTPVPATPDEIVIGRHGVCVVQGERRGVLLPQVAPQYGWDRIRLLEELCRKADIPPDAWLRDECQLLLFESEIFGDAGENPETE